MPDTVRESNTRIPVRGTTRDDLRDFAYGFNRGTYDDAIVELLRLYMKPGESALQAGMRLAQEADRRPDARD